MQSFMYRTIKNKYTLSIVCCVTLIAVSTFIGSYNVSNSGLQWVEDDARYLNNGAMMRDYLISGELLAPYSFAKKNYTQYPGFSVPYHPPGYPFLLGLWFLLVGMTYESARLFTGICLGTIGCFFFGILRKQEMAIWTSYLGALLLVTTPEIVRWSRSNMSEIPALAFLMMATYCFFRWVENEKSGWYWVAFISAGVAFFSRISTAGILPSWFLYILVFKGVKKLIKPSIFIPPLLYLTCGYAWTKFASSFAMHEIRSGLIERLSRAISWENLTVWFVGLPSMMGFIALGAAVIVIIHVWRKGYKKQFALFGLFWFMSYYLFQVAMATHFEARYFLFSLPGIVALASLLPPLVKKSYNKYQ